MIIFAYMLVTAALYYLGSRATITKFLWSRYPRRVDAFMLCAACSGAWYGLGVALVGAWKQWSVLGLPGRDAVTVIGVVLGSMVWTPILAAVHLWALDQTAAVNADE